MKLMLWLTLLYTSFLQKLNAPDIIAVRELYVLAATQKEAADKLSYLLADINPSSSPLLICFKGCSEMMASKYAVNPYNKYRKFKTGKAYIEQANKLDSNNIEIRFLRFSVQTNLPSFLGYREEINKDKNFLISHLTLSKDANLKKTVINYLAGSGYCTQEELKKLKQ